MKWLFAAAAAAVVCLWGLPFREYDTQRLLPVQTLQVAQTRRGVRVVSEVGEGTGRDFEAAVENLKEQASGHVFLETAEQVVFCGAAWRLSPAVARTGLLRPSAQVYYMEAAQAPEGLNELLSAHESTLTMADLAAGGGS